MNRKTEHQDTNLTEEPSGSWLERNGIVTLAVGAQLIALLITLPTWQVRSAPVNLPLFDVPQIPYLWLVAIFASAISAWWLRRFGSWIHLAVLILACCWDQFRIQPQFFFGWVFIWAACDLQTKRTDGLGLVFCRWSLIILWFWAGFHKLYSPEWMGHASCNFLWKMGLPRDAALNFHVVFAILVGAGEMVVALFAFIRPRVAAVFGVLLHVGILVALTCANWNYSVFPWNLLATYFCFRLFLNHEWKFSGRELVVGSLMMLAPALFYFGQVDRAFAMVLYSGMTPKGQITHADGREYPIEKITGWGHMAVPFPAEVRTNKQYFDLTAAPGSKLHILDKRMTERDQFFLKTDGGIVEIDKTRFFRGTADEILGSAIDDAAARFEMDKAQIERKQRDKVSMVHAITFTPENYSRRLLSLVSGYPNVEQIQLSNTTITDEDLKLLNGLQKLQGIGLNNTDITINGLMQLKDLPNLTLIQVDPKKFTGLQIQEVFQNLDK